jgi:Ion channel
MKKHHTYFLTQIIDRIIRMPYGRLFTMYAAILILCATAYALLHIYLPEHGPTLPDGSLWQKIGNALYFSVITATSIGYGDINPQGLSKVIAGLEGLGALFIFAILVSKPISYRQELALGQVHTLTFSDIFTNLREGLFIVRKDLEAVAERTKTERSLSAKDWRNLTVIWHHYASLIEMIPEFYAGEIGLYTVDRRREVLLIEAVERTLERMATVVISLRENGIRLEDDAESDAERKAVTALTQEIIERWKLASPYGDADAFKRMQKAAASLAAA